MKFSLLLVSMIFINLALGQQPGSQNPCTVPETKQFDFWIGDWDLTWNDSLHGTNHVERIMESCTVQENFYDPKLKYSGKSWSVYSPVRKQWQQTWVDTQGGYISLTGGMVGDSMVLTTPERVTPKGKMISRMVFYNIKKDSFDWSWETFVPERTAWTANWKIHYERHM
jgi:hypothetical protein